MSTHMIHNLRANQPTAAWTGFPFRVTPGNKANVLGAAAAKLDNQEAWLLVGQRFGLSSQELKVALYILAGAKVAAIAAELGLGLGTVKTYCQRIYQKLRVSDHCSLAVVMLSHFFDASYRAVPPTLNPIQPRPRRCRMSSKWMTSECPACATAKTM